MRTKVIHKCEVSTAALLKFKLNFLQRSLVSLQSFIKVESAAIILDLVCFKSRMQRGGRNL